MVEAVIERLARLMRGRWLAVAVTAILVYFGYHALHGQRGFLAWVDRSRDLEAARQELARLGSERAKVERDVHAFQRDQIDRDLLEEELRKLGYVKPNEVVILRHDADQPGTPG
jgi:cell division protein FtsB